MNVHVNLMIINVVKYLEKIHLITPLPILKIKYLLKFKRLINLETPQTLNEKIIWLSFNTHTERWSELADKYLVRKHIQEIGLGHTLVKLYGKYDHAEEIDFEKLPSSFVIKTNNGCGQVILVKDKSKLDIPETIKKLDNFLKTPFGVTSVELHYLRIKPCIIIEELLEPDNAISTSIIDYKVWCFNGKPSCVLTVCNRDLIRHKIELGLYSIDDWSSLNHFISRKFKNETVVPKPKLLSQMMEYAKIISKEFPQVRVDFYEINNKVYFGELTFTSNGGLMAYFTHEFQLELGKQLDISNYQKSHETH